MGPLQSRWYARGYQDGMQDIRDAFERGGVEAVKMWLNNNKAQPLPTK